MVKQISVFLENKEGNLAEFSRLLSADGNMMRKKVILKAELSRVRSGKIFRMILNARYAQQIKLIFQKPKPVKQSALRLISDCFLPEKAAANHAPQLFYIQVSQSSKLHSLSFCTLKYISLSLVYTECNSHIACSKNMFHFFLTHIVYFAKAR